MPRRGGRWEQYRQREWRCQAGLKMDRWEFPELAWHVCVLGKDHFGHHECWCGTLFEQNGLAMRQVSLPGLESPYRPDHIA